MMKLLESMIQEKGTIKEGNIVKVDSFLNHQIDIELLNECGKEFKKRFADCKVTKILTLEASGIAIACIAAQYFKTPVVFAKKSEASNLSENVYESRVISYTKAKEYNIKVDKDYIKSSDKVLIIDDFLAQGEAVAGLLSIIKQAEANLVGIGIIIEKGFQQGGKKIREKGLRLESLAIIDSIEDGIIQFRK